MRLGDKFERRAVETPAGRRAELERLEDFALGEEAVAIYRSSSTIWTTGCSGSMAHLYAADASAN